LNPNSPSYLGALQAWEEEHPADDYHSSEDQDTNLADNLFAGFDLDDVAGIMHFIIALSGDSQGLTAVQHGAIVELQARARESPLFEDMLQYLVNSTGNAILQSHLVDIIQMVMALTTPAALDPNHEGYGQAREEFDEFIAKCDELEAAPVPATPALKKDDRPANYQERVPRGHMRDMDHPFNQDFDRKPVQMGMEDPSKFNMSYWTLKKDNKGRWIKGILMKPSFVHEYREIFDWKNRDHIKKLNAWREQYTRRGFGKVRTTRAPWLNSEKFAILANMQNQLKEDPNRKAFAWNRLANEYNRDAYSIQPANQRIASEMRINPNARTSGPRYTTEPREKPWRTRAAIEGRRIHWPEMIQLIPNKNTPKVRPRAKDDHEYENIDPRADPNKYKKKRGQKVKDTQEDSDEEEGELVYDYTPSKSNHPGPRPRRDSEDDDDEFGGGGGFVQGTAPISVF